MRYTKWQVGLIRAALRDHKKYFVDQNGIGFGWNTISDDIADLAGVSVPGESIRRFVEGANKKTDPLRYSIPDDARLEAIVTYLAHPDIDALRPSELEPNEPSYTAAARLRDYLAYDLSDSEPTVARALEGEYSGMYWRDGFTYVAEIHIELPGDGSLLLVHERAEVFRDEDRQFPQWSESERKANWKRKNEAVGWGIPTPEDNVLIFMKDQPYHSNHFWSLATEPEETSPGTIERLHLLHQDYPEPVAADGAAARIVRFARSAAIGG